MPTTARPLPPPTDAPGLRAVYCVHCQSRRPLAFVGPGTLVLKHRGYHQRLTGLTSAQQVWVLCPRCREQQRILVPVDDSGVSQLT